MITNSQTRTQIDEVADGIYRIHTPVDVPAIPGGFSFNQYLIVDEEPMLFHSGLRRMFPLVQEAIAQVIPVDKLRYIGLSHYEADESGSLNEFLAVAPQAVPLCSDVGAMVSVDDVADRPARGMADGEVLRLGKHQLEWIYTPHVPHGWDCGLLYDRTTGTLLCGDLFTQPGQDHPPVTTQEVLTPSEAMREPMDYYAHNSNTGKILEKLAALNPKLLACMHGSAYAGDGAQLLRELKVRVQI